MPVRLVILGGGPAGVAAAATAARLGADVTLVEREIIGGAANLWDCIPSKSMIASGAGLSFSRRSSMLGINLTGEPPDLEALRSRVRAISQRLSDSATRQLESQGVRLIRGSGRFVDDHTIAIEASDTALGEDVPRRIEADAVMISTGSVPRVPTWAPIDGDRVLITARRTRHR